MARGACGCCGNEYNINADGTVRYHLAVDPECHESPDSRKCRGVGQLPAGAKPETEPGDIRFLCRVPSGPTGCGHQVQLTANRRARSHLTPHGEKCAEGGSAFPIAVGPDGYRADTAEWTEEDWLKVFPKPAPAPEVAVSRTNAPRPVETVDLPHDRQGDGSVAGPTAFITELKTAVGDPGTVERQLEVYRSAIPGGLAIGNSCTCNLIDIEGPARDCPEHGELPRLDPVECACNLEWANDAAMRRAGHDDMDCESAPMVAGPVEPEDVFDVIHRHTDESGTEWVHPGTVENCRLPDCCTHPRGFDWMDDDNGHSGSFCFFCGMSEEWAMVKNPPAEPEWGTPADLLERMPADLVAAYADRPVCWECGDRLMLCVESFEPDGTPRSVVWCCDRNCEHMQGSGHHGRACRPQMSWQDRLGYLERGEFFRRHRAVHPLDSLVYRVEAADLGEVDIVSAIVVSAGRYQGRVGELTDLSEEITCTDHNGQRLRRPRLGPPPTPSPPAPTPSPSPAPSSGPGTTASAPRPPATSGATSKRATTSGPTAKAASSTQSAGRTDVATAKKGDAFVTAKAAASESDKYDRFGRYKLTHPVTGKEVKWTRATTYAKSIQDTYALSMWSQRMTLKGASLRSDIVAAVSTLDVKADKDRINALVEDAKKAAGDKVAANLGTAVHAFTEDRDKATVGIPVKARAIPDDLRPSVDAYEAALLEFGLEPVPGLIEFTTAVQQYEICGTSDRTYKVTRDITFKLNGRTVTLYAGEYVIGDVKTGADLSYGWQEICIQLAIYAQGLNTSGVFDWNTRTWGKPVLADNPDVLLKVRTDVALVPHLPVDRKPGTPLATLYAIDLDAGWAAAVLCGQVRQWRKTGNLATALTVADVDGDAPEGSTVGVHAGGVLASRPPTLEEKAKAVVSREGASAVWQEAVAARVSKTELDRLVGLMSEKLKSHVEKGA